MKQITLLTTLLLGYCDSARILGVVPTPSISHQIAFRPFWRELLLRGHEITLITSDPMTDPDLKNLTQIDIHFMYKHWEELIPIIINDTNPLKIMEIIVTMIGFFIEQQLQSDGVQKLIRNETERFDLVLIESPYPVMVAYSERFKCPFINIISLEPSATIYAMTGTPSHPALYPDVNLPFIGKLTFFQRLASTACSIFLTGSQIYFASDENAIIKRYFGKEYPPAAEMWKGISLLLINNNKVLEDSMRALNPSVVNIGGGTHIQKSQPLPQDLKVLLDNVTDGFIYFSLGTNVKSNQLSDGLLDALIETFAESNFNVLWKFGDRELPRKPENVFTSNWFPQQDIIRHPKIKLFITQGGLQSIEESIYSHVPVLTMPFFGDQFKNAKRIEKQGFGLVLEHKTLKKDELESAIKELIENPKYRENARYLAELARDEPMTGLEQAIWWTEYVIRHKGAKHLRSPVLDLPLYQYYLLDVIAFFLLIFVAIIHSLKIIFKLIAQLIKKLLNLKVKIKSK